MLILNLEEENIRVKKLKEVSRYMYYYISFYLTLAIFMLILDTFKRYYLIT